MRDKDKYPDGYLFDCKINTEPVLISACLLGIPCRWHGRRPKKRQELIGRLKKRAICCCPQDKFPEAAMRNVSVTQSLRDEVNRKRAELEDATAKRLWGIGGQRKVVYNIVK